MTPTPHMSPFRQLKTTFQPQAFLKIGSILALGVIVLQSLLFRLGPSWRLSLGDEVLVVVCGLLAVLGLAYGSYHTRIDGLHLQRTWRLLALAGLTWAISDLIALIMQAAAGKTPFPSLADGFHLAAYPIMLASILLIPSQRRTSAETAEYILDVAIIILSAGLVIWNFVVGPFFLSGETHLITVLVTTAYPIADVVLLWAAILLISVKFTLQPRQPLWILFAALITMATLDTILTYRKVTGMPNDGDVLNLLKTSIPLLLMLSGLMQAAVMNKNEESKLSSQAVLASQGMALLRLALPYLWLGSAYVVLWYGPTSGQVISSFTMFSWVAVVLGVVILRQMFVMFENQRLTAQLHHVNNDLEQLFVERTAALIRTNEELRREVFERDRMERMLRERDDKLVYFSFHDMLTGLPNRALLIERLGQALRRIKRQEEYHFAVLYLDFDGFKYINDSLGHQAGDKLLNAIARRLESCVRDLDTVSRLGGDEFVVMADGIHQGEDALVAVKRLQDVLASPFELEGHKVFMSASIGVVIGDETYDQATDILRDADLAMYQAKASGKSRYVIFTQDMRVSALNRLILETDMRLALENGEFKVHYQPILDLGKDRVVGFEALLRWTHPEHGAIAPLDIIPVAETTGLIVPITECVLRQACEQLQAWISETSVDPNLTVSVNLSTKLFSEPDLANLIGRILQETHLPPRNLKLEITETAIIEDAEAATRMLNACRAMGVQVYIDDFGTGYSALSYLHQFPIDTLKIDRAFIDRIQEGGTNSEVVRTIIALARELDLEVIAEGVETEAQFDYLKKLGCQGGQGYYIARPLAPDAAREFIAKQSWR
jgi:diguanylate cyclase (GGDEF)-like protein